MGIDLQVRNSNLLLSNFRKGRSGSKLMGRLKIKALVLSYEGGDREYIL